MTTETSGEADPGRDGGPGDPGTPASAQAVKSAERPARSLSGLPRLQLPSWPSPRVGGRRARAGHPVVRHLIILAGYLAAGIAVTWPRVTYLFGGKLPSTRDTGVYVWDFWWIAHQVEHLGNPWYTRAIAAPFGAQLGYHALMPLEGLVMLPVTVAFGPSASFNLLSVLMPGLMGYAMYRAARLWLPTQVGAIAAGAFFGLSSDMTWHAWYQLNLAAGALFLPLALEASVRLRRNPRPWQAVILGVVIGGCLLTDQESAVLVAILAALVLLPWLLRWRWPGTARAGRHAEGNGRPADSSGEAATNGNGAAAPPAHGQPPATWRVKLLAVGTAAAAALVVASPQIAAMVAQTRSGGAWVPAAQVDQYYTTSGSNLPGMFAVSPRVDGLGLTFLKVVSYPGPIGDGVPTFGLILSLTALLGLIVCWRRRSTRLLGLLWFACVVLALGSTIRLGNHVFVPFAQAWYRVRVSLIMPFTWFVQIPGMAGFREATRWVMLGLVPASLLAGAGFGWLARRSKPLTVVVLVAAAMEAGWAGDGVVNGWGSTPAPGVMPTTLPALDRPIAADHSSSIVVDVPFGVRGGVPLPGEGGAFNPEDQVLATADGHPRAIAYLSRLPAQTLAAMRKNAFYMGLLKATYQPDSYPVPISAASANARRLDIGWVIVWQQTRGVRNYLAGTGFRLDYQADGAYVYRPAADLARR
ncbi:MAG TPA: hypothetical protein VIX86_02545 [Streptosporangiaceae bacterium]